LAVGSSVWVPREFKERLVSLSRRYGKPQWKILLDALAMYEAGFRRSRGKEELPKVDKVVWYIEKLSMSVGAFKENPTKENLEKSMKTLAQVRERLQVDTGILERALNDYFKLVGSLPEDPVERHTVLDEVTMEVNMALKSVLIEIVYRHILKEEPTPGT